MARISEYENAHSEKSAQIIDYILKDAVLEPREIIAFQYQYGISNLELSRLSGHAMAQLTVWKNGSVEIPKRVQQHFTLLFAQFKKQFSE